MKIFDSKLCPETAEFGLNDFLLKEILEFFPYLQNCVGDDVITIKGKLPDL